jgi:hypothetical protein
MQLQISCLFHVKLQHPMLRGTMSSLAYKAHLNASATHTVAAHSASRKPDGIPRPFQR